MSSPGYWRVTIDLATFDPADDAQLEREIGSTISDGPLGKLIQRRIQTGSIEIDGAHSVEDHRTPGSADGPA